MVKKFTWIRTNMKGEFRVKLLDKTIVDYTDFNDIPDKVYRILKFIPDYPPSPHSEEDHKLIETFDNKLHELLRRETDE